MSSKGMMPPKTIPKVIGLIVGSIREAFSIPSRSIKSSIYKEFNDIYFYRKKFLKMKSISLRLLR